MLTVILPPRLTNDSLVDNVALNVSVLSTTVSSYIGIYTRADVERDANVTVLDEDEKSDPAV